MIAGKGKSLFVLVLSPHWFLSILLYHISQWIPGPTEIEIPVPTEVSGVEHDLNGNPCSLVLYPVQWYCRIQRCDPFQIYVLPLLISLASPGYIFTLFPPREPHFFFCKDCACDICDRSCLPYPWISSHGDYSPTEPALLPCLIPMARFSW